MEQKVIIILVDNPAGIEKFGELVPSGWRIISNENVATRLRDQGIPCDIISRVEYSKEFIEENDTIVVVNFEVNCNSFISSINIEAITLLLSAIKNAAHCLPVSCYDQYDFVVNIIKKTGGMTDVYYPHWLVGRALKQINNYFAEMFVLADGYNDRKEIFL